MSWFHSSSWLDNTALCMYTYTIHLLRF
jgi:hypothetical protein